MSGNVTSEGARLDLEWMQRVGIGGVHAFAGGMLEPPMVPHPLPFMSDGWSAIYRDAVRQARAAGMDVAVAGSPGWSETGAPWVKPEQAMKKYVWSTLEVTGGKRAMIRLPEPPAVTGPFQSIPRPANRYAPGAPDAPAVLARGDGPVIAFRSPDPDTERRGSYSIDGRPLPQLAGVTGDLTKVVRLPIGDQGLSIDIDLGRAQTIRAATVAIDTGQARWPALEFLASDDGRSFRSVRAVSASDAENPVAQQTFALPATTARFVRVHLDRPPAGRALVGLPPGIPNPRAPNEMGIRMVTVHGSPRVDQYEAKAGFQSIVDRRDAPAQDKGVPLADVIDLTSRLRPGGILDWTPPKGRWTILRFGWSLTGQTNGPAEPSATGLEVDKLDPAAVRAYLDGLFALYRDRSGVALGANGVNALLTDSWEAGVQNWTPSILADFKRLRGYDPMPWLPVLAGHVVENSARSEAFLFDFRQTLKELVVQSHYAVLASEAHRNGMIYYTEVQGDTPRAITDGLTAKAQSDIPTGEFWYRPFATDPGQPSLVADLREAASAAHIYGKKLVAAESLTVAAGSDPWAFSPAMLKPVADQIFAEGVNRILLHESHLQPFVDKKPGLTMAFFGQFFNRNDTWAERAKPWIDYLARSSWMLQQGQYVADIACFYGEEENLTQRFEHEADKAVPEGYGYDYVSADALLNRMSVHDGSIVTDSGMAYRVLYVPDYVTRMTLPVVRKLAELVNAGGTVVAKRPQAGLGMADEPAFASAVAALWDAAGADGRVGKGRIVASGTLRAAIDAFRLVPDVQIPSGVPLMTLHRRTADADIYYVSNRADQPRQVPVAFRVKGRAADYWIPETGETRPLSYRTEGDLTRVELDLSAYEAGFVVFRRPGSATGEIVPTPRQIAAKDVAGPWSVRFQPGRGAPATATFSELTDWSTNADPGIRYFSGAATYSHALNVGREDLASGRRAILDLGAVHDVATVSLNGKEVATLWHAPYRLDVTSLLKRGTNRLNIEVVNLWPNRLIGDKQPGAKPVTYAPQSPYGADSKLLPSGLLGPVQLLVEDAPARPARPPRQ
jgi:hypothetical protein